MSGYSAGWRLCLTDRPSYINLTDAGSGSNRARWPHTRTYTKRRICAHTHTETCFTHTVGQLQASAHVRAHTSCRKTGWEGEQTDIIYIQALRKLPLSLAYKFAHTVHHLNSEHL